MRGKMVMPGLIMAMLLVASFTAFFASAAGLEKEYDGLRYVPHSVIKIESDADFASQGWPGSGTSDDPYVISGLEIDAQGGGYAIYIGNTTAYFVIQDSLLYNASYSSIPYQAGAAIILYHVSNGRVYSNEVNNNTHGIYVNGGGGNTIDSNNVRDNDNNGIWVVLSSDNSVVLNTCIDNGQTGITLYSAQNNTVESNTCENSNDGIALWSESHGNQVKFNTVSFSSDNGIYLSGPSGGYMNNVLLYKNTLFNNTYGIHTLYLQNASIRENEAYNSTNYGIYLDTGSSYNTIEKNHVHDNLKSGVYIYTYSTSTPSDHNVVMWNNMSFNDGEGLYLSRSSYNDVHNNMFYNNSGYGITIYSSSNNNRVYENSFYFNHGSTDSYSSSAVQASDYGSGNAWNISYEGNFWYDWQSPDSDGDGIVDNPYAIDGSANSRDELPLTTPTAVPEMGQIALLAIIGIAFLVLVARRRL